MKIAFMYPGQGAQKNGMMQDFYEQCAEARDLFNKASSISGYDIPDLCFHEKEASRMQHVVFLLENIQHW